MTGLRGRSLRVTAGVLALAVFLLAAIALLPAFINRGPVRTAVESWLSQRLGAQISYGKADLSFFPGPVVTVRNGTAVLRGRVEGSFDSLEVRLKVLPLLLGKPAVSSVRLETPKARILLKESEENKFPGLEKLRSKLTVLFRALAEKAPNLRIEMKNGSIVLQGSDGRITPFSDLYADCVFPPTGPKVMLTGSSQFSRAIKVLIQMDQKSLSGNGEIDLKGVSIKPLMGYLIPDGLTDISGPPSDLSLRFRINGMSTIEGEMSSTISSLTLKRKGKQLMIHGTGLRGGFAVGEDRSEVSLRELGLSDPHLVLAGTLAVDKGGRIDMKIEGREIDLDAARRAAYDLAGDVPIVQDISSYVKGGTVPRVTVFSQASSFEDLGNTENIRVKGRMEKGEVFVEGAGLDFKGVYGDFDIVNGMLDGAGISGGLEKIRLRNGKVRIGLKGAVVPLSIDALVEADMGAVQGLLKRLVKNEDVVREIALFTNVEGSAAGRLVLKGRSDVPEVKADMEEIYMSADYARLPYPLKITGGGIYFDEKRASARGLRGSVGRSSFSGLTAALGLEKRLFLDVTSASFSISLAEAYHWLGSYETLRPVLQRIGSVEGELSLSSLQFKGPLLSHSEWRFRTSGGGRDIALTASGLPGSVAIAKANVAATEETLSVSGAKIRMLDSAVELSGELSEYMKDSRNIDMSLKGSVGPESFRWISDSLRFPPWLRNSLSLSVSQSHLLLESGGATALSGIVTVSRGPEVSFDIISDDKGLRINRLLIEDASSRASVSLSLDDRKLGLAFSGKLTGKTAGSLMDLDGYSGGWISGDFQGEVFRERPVKFTAGGKMSAEGFVIPWKETAPLEIPVLSAEADGKRVRLNTCKLKWGEDEVSLRGDLTSSNKGIIVDMDASASVIEADRVIEKVEKIGKGREKQGDREVPVPSAGGILRLRAGRFRYGSIDLEPFNADISLEDKALSVVVAEAGFCGISLQGRVDINGGETSIDFRPSASNGSVESTISCLSRSFGLDEYATGTFDLSGNISGRGRKKDVLRSISGDIDFTARDGRIYNVPSVLKMVGFLDATGIARGFGDVWRKGLRYDKVLLKATLNPGRIEIVRSVLDGPSVKIASQGYVDLEASRLDIKALVSPVRTVDRITKKVPLLSGILGGSMISIPVHVTGDVKDPQVETFFLSSADSGLMGMMKNTLRLPFNVFTPFLPEKGETEKGQGGQR